MRIKLLAPHIIDDVQYPTDTVLDVRTVTPLMQGLDAEAVAAIAEEKVRVYGRWVGQWPHFYLLDDPPIVRSLENAQPVPPVGSSDGPPR
jgi:hypothetical protein